MFTLFAFLPALLADVTIFGGNGYTLGAWGALALYRLIRSTKKP